MLQYYRKIAATDPFSSIPSRMPGCWVHVEQATHKDIETVCSIVQLHITDLIDALDFFELPRWELIQGNLIVFVRYPCEHETHQHTAPLTIVLTPEYFITISPTSSRLTQAILSQEGSIINAAPSHLFLSVLLRISQEFSSQIRQKRNHVMAQGKDLSGIDSEDISLLTKQEEILNQYLSSLDLFHNLLEDIHNTVPSLLNQKNYRDLDDIANAVKQSETLTMTLIKNIRNLRDSYQIIFANRLTKTITLLTALTIIFSIPNIVASIYGMNVKLPIGDNPHAFAFLMVIMLGISSLCGYWFYHKKWM